MTTAQGEIQGGGNLISVVAIRGGKGKGKGKRIKRKKVLTGGK